MQTEADKLSYIEHGARKACRDSSQVEYNKLQSMGSDMPVNSKAVEKYSNCYNFWNLIYVRYHTLLKIQDNLQNNE